VSDAAARVDAAAIWGVDSVPDASGLDAEAMVAAAAAGTLSALVVAGAEIRDLPGDGSKAMQRADFVLALDTRAHEVTEFADVVLPVAAAPEKAGRFINWEGRDRPFDQALRETQLLSDARVLAALRDAMGVTRGASTLAELRAQWQEFAGWSGTRVSPPAEAANTSRPTDGLLLSTWQPLLSGAALQQDEPYLAATARDNELSLDAATAASLGLSDGDLATVSTAHGSITAQTRVAEVASGTAVVTGDVASSLRAVSGDEVSVKGASR
jgi:NADH-quinone oxidoreductase subunit G